ncbi:antibiotic biosynthesis monooxygenase [Umezawaea beigongshangensis]|uniref:antibiotic biosynthesis monooxygenase n=1 Tax=Umezawaea beigongshangensis TaxID=2780383 RepID=UPI0018F1979B|nr:antibiotic biosynthesis monooxygenase [Umezawaea beigongshangensis]
MNPDAPVVLTTTHRVTAGRLADFSVSARGLLSAASRTPGCLGGGLVGSPSGERTWQIVCRFDSDASADSWERSGSFLRWSRYVQRFADTGGVQRTRGDTSIGQATRPAMRPVAVVAGERRGWRPAAVTFLAVVPAVALVDTASGPVLADQAPLVRVAVLCVAAGGSAALVFAPALSRLLGWWAAGDAPRPPAGGRRRLDARRDGRRGTLDEEPGRATAAERDDVRAGVSGRETLRRETPPRRETPGWIDDRRGVPREERDGRHEQPLPPAGDPAPPTEPIPVVPAPVRPAQRRRYFHTSPHRVPAAAARPPGR